MGGRKVNQVIARVARSATRAARLATLTCAVACSGNIVGDASAPSQLFIPGTGQAGVGSSGAAGHSGATGSSGNTGSAGSGGGAGSSGGHAGSASTEAPSAATRAARLTHREYENTLRDLLHIEDVSSAVADLRPDPAQAGFLFDNDGKSLSVDSSLFTSYQRVAATLAQRVADDAALLRRVTGDATSAEAFVRAFGLRAHRRPLSDQEVAEYTTLHGMGAALDPSRSAFDAGVRLIIEAMLQSPSFLYRVETSADERGGVIPLNDYEVASRLSYALWGSMPDSALFDAAGEGALTNPAGVAAHAERLLSDPRAEAMVEHFHAQLFETERFTQITPSSSAFPDVSRELGAYALEEHERFVRDVVFERGGTYTDLLTSTETFVNAELAEIYGLSGTFGDEFVPAMLNPGERRGVLTQIGFLAANATSTTPDPIHRGVFIARRIACLPLAAPPANLPPLPPAAGRTNRETIEAHTEQPGSVCAMCHAPIINPLGFPFESFDAVGAFRTEDNGHPVDTTAKAPVGAQRVEVTDAVELADALAASVDVHSCYTKHWIEQLHGRAATTADNALRTRLGEASARGELTIRGMIVALVSSPAFLNRSVEELP